MEVEYRCRDRNKPFDGHIGLSNHWKFCKAAKARPAANVLIDPKARKKPKKDKIKRYRRRKDEAVCIVHGLPKHRTKTKNENKKRQDRAATYDTDVLWRPPTLEERVSQQSRLDRSVFEENEQRRLETLYHQNEQR